MAYIGNIPTKGENNSFKLLDNIKTYTETFDGSSSSVINNGADSINVNNHRFIQGQRVVYSSSGGTVITGLSDGAAYYIIKEDHNNFKLASSSGNADSGTVLPIAPAGSTTNHKLTVGFDAINTKFLASYDGGTKAQVTRSAQLNISINGVVQEPQDTKTPTAGFGHDVGSVIVFSTAPDGNDSFWGNLVANNFPTFDQSDNKIDNFTGDNTTTDFSLSRTPPDNRNILVTLDGVTQHPSDASTTRAYTLAENILSFTSAPASLVSIQVRHIGFAGAGGAGGGGGGGVTSVYGRSGAVVLKPTDNPTVGNVSAGGWISVGSTANFDGNVTVGGNLDVTGNLNYENVTDVISTGIITAKKGIRVPFTTATDPLSYIGIGTNGKYLKFYNDGSNSNIYAGEDGGSLLISGNNIDLRAPNSHVYFRAKKSAEVELRANNSKKLETSGDGVEITGVTTSTKRIDIDAGGLNVTAGISTFGGGVAIGATLNVTGVSTFNTNVNFVGAIAGVTSCLWDATNNRLQIKDKAELGIGDGPDIKMYHNGSWSYIENYTGELHVKSDTIQLMSWTGGEEFIRATLNGSVDLYFDDVKRVETTGGGISVAGIVTATSFNGAGISSTSSYPNYRPTLDFNFAAVKKLDPRFTYMRTGPGSYIDHLGFVRISGYNEPRFDHDPMTGECKGLLIEQNTTNQMIYSNDITGDTAQNGTITGNVTTAPDGTLTADKFACNTTNGLHRVDMPFTSGQISNSTAYTFSVFVKANGYDKLHIRYGGYNADDHGLGYDLSDGTTFAGKYDGTSALGAVTSSSMIEYPNGWYRCSFTVTTAADAASGVCQIFYYISNSEATTNFAGDGSSGMYFWGSQFESCDYATSLVVTDGETRTRGGETLTIEGEEFTDFYNQAEGTLVLSASYTEDIRTSAAVTIDDTSNESEYTEIGYRAGGSGSGKVGAYTRTDAGNDQYFKGFDNSATQGNEFKVAFGYKDNDYASSANGSAIHTDTSGTTSKVFDRLRFSDVDTVGPSGSGHYRRFMYYPKRLPDSQLLGLTS